MTTATTKGRTDGSAADSSSDTSYSPVSLDDAVVARDISDAERWSDEGGALPAEGLSTETLTAPAEAPVVVASGRRGEYVCECGHALRVFGGGRHRVYFELTAARLDDPVMNRACPQCGRGLPGKNQP